MPRMYRHPDSSHGVAELIEVGNGAKNFELLQDKFGFSRTEHPHLDWISGATADQCWFTKSSWLLPREDRGIRVGLAQRRSSVAERAQQGPGHLFISWPVDPQNTVCGVLWTQVNGDLKPHGW